jgi:HK97 family phage major capsid protein
VTIPVEVETALRALATEAAEKAVSSRQVANPMPVIPSKALEMTPAQRMGLRLQKAYVDQYGHLDSRLTRAERELINQKAGLLALTSNEGSQLVPVPLSDEIIIPLREKSVLMQAGCRRFAYDSSLQLGKMTAGVTLAWGAEAAAPSASTAATTAITLSAYQVAGYLQISNMALKSSPDVAAAVAEDVQNALVAEFDAKALIGTGANSQPTGVVGQIAAANSNNATGSATNATIRTDLATHVKLVRNSTPDVSRGFWVTSPSIFYSLLGKSDANGWHAFPTLHNTVPTLLGFPVYVTTAITVSSIMFATADNILLGTATNEVGAGLQGADLVQGTTTVYARLGMDAKLKYDTAAAVIEACGSAGWY